MLCYSCFAMLVDNRRDGTDERYSTKQSPIVGSQIARKSDDKKLSYIVNRTSPSSPPPSIQFFSRPSRRGHSEPLSANPHTQKKGLCGDAQRGVEGIRGGLALLRRCGGRRSGARADGIVGGLALGVQLLADEVGDDLDAQRGAVVEVGLVDGRERLLRGPVLLGAEGDGRVAARAEVERGTAVLGEPAVLGAGDGGSDLGRCGVRLEEVLGDDAANCVVGIVARVALAGCVANLFSRVSDTGPYFYS